MKGKTAPPTHSIGSLIEQVRDLVQSARRAAIANVNTLQVLTNFEIGRLIVEHVQRGEHRATYGKETLKHLAASLTAEFGRGFSERNLEYMRKFFLAWKERASQISQKPSEKSQPTAPIAQAGALASAEKAARGAAPLPLLRQRSFVCQRTRPAPSRDGDTGQIVLMLIS